MNMIKPTTINKNEIYAYLGIIGAQPDTSTQSLVDTCITEILAAAEPREIHTSFNLGFLHDGFPYISSEKFTLTGQDVSAHLAGCFECIMLAVTLGAQY